MITFVTPQLAVLVEVPYNTTAKQIIDYDLLNTFVKVLIKLEIIKIRIKKAYDVKEKIKIIITGFTSISLAFGMKKEFGHF